MRLPEKVHRWIDRNKGGAEKDPQDTAAYADFILSFGLARLGEASEARKLQQRGQAWLTQRPDDEEVHSTLLQAFSFRIEQALDSKPFQGQLPSEQLEYIEHMERLPRYKVDYMRSSSRILEPHERIHPYRLWVNTYFGDLEKTVATLMDIRDNQILAEQIQQLLTNSWKDEENREKHLLVMTKALELAPRIGEEFTLEILGRMSQALELLNISGIGEETTEEEVREKANFLEKALFAAAHFNHVEFAPPLIGQFEKLLRSLRGSKNLFAVESLSRECFRNLRKLGMRDQIERLLRVLEDVVLQGKKVGSLRASETSWKSLAQLLHVASNWYYFGLDAQARPVMDLARSVLYHGELRGPAQANLACAYVSSLGQAPLELAQPGIEEIFCRLDRVYDAYVSNTHFSPSQLKVIEAVVLAVVTEEFAVGTAARHWLDDDEFLVRRRIHRDMQAALSQAHI
jgi:hypothetical protein